MAFYYFGKLPTELQIKIWWCALLAESQERVVLLHDRHVVPRRPLISPLLATNKLCREEGLRLYTLSLEVVGIPVTEVPCPAPSRSAVNHEQRVMRDELKKHLSNLSKYQRRGTLYLNPTHDTFIKGLDFAPQYVRLRNAGLHFDMAYRESDTMLGHSRGENGELPVRPITTCLDEQACRRIEQLVVAEQGRDGSAQQGTVIRPFAQNGGSVPDFRSIVYMRAYADEIWERRTFSGCREFRHLWVAPHLEGLGVLLEGTAGCAWALLTRELAESAGGGGGGGGDRSRLNIRPWTAVEQPLFSGVAGAWVYDVAEAERSGQPSCRLSSRLSMRVRGGYYLLP